MEGRLRRRHYPSPGMMKTYVRVFASRVALVCLHVPLSSYFRTQDLNDPNTFPGHQGGPHSLDIIPSQIGSGSTLTYTHTSPPKARGYHGLPMV